MKKIFFGLTAFLLFFIFSFSLEAHATVFIQAETITSFKSNYPFLSGQWEGITCASDGKIYFFVSSHAKEHSAHMFSYDPGKGQLELIADLGEIIEEAEEATVTHGKVHSEIHEDNGTLYFTTHWAHHAKDVGYSGGHFLSYNIKTKEFRDYGVGLKGHGLITMTYDPKYKLCYALTCKYPDLEPPVQLIVMNPQDGRITNKGTVQTAKETCRVMFVDDNGEMYWSTPPGTVGRYNPATAELTFLKQHLPVNPDNADMQKDYRKISTQDMWRWIVWDKQNKMAYGLITYNIHLFSFDPAKEKFRDIGYFGAADRSTRETVLGYALIPGETLYYMASGKDNSHLIAYDIKAGKITDHGPVKTGDKNIIYCGSLAAGKDGKLYLVARVKGKDPKEEEVRFLAIDTKTLTK